MLRVDEGEKNIWSERRLLDKYGYLSPSVLCLTRLRSINWFCGENSMISLTAASYSTRGNARHLDFTHNASWSDKLPALLDYEKLGYFLRPV
jgi:hypothetical protein